MPQFWAKKKKIKVKFLRTGKEVEKIFDFIFHHAETFFGIQVFLENFLGYCIILHFHNF